MHHLHNGVFTARNMLHLYRQVDIDIARHKRNKGIDELLHHFLVVRRFVDILIDNAFYQRIDQQLIALVVEYAARKRTGMLKNKFQYAFLRLQVTIVKADKEKFGGGFYIQPVTILRGEQKQVSLAVIKFIAVDAVPARSVYNIQQLKKIVPVHRLQTFIRFFVNDFERLVKIFSGHTRKGTEQTQNYTGADWLRSCNFALQPITLRPSA